MFEIAITSEVTVDGPRPRGKRRRFGDPVLWIYGTVVVVECERFAVMSPQAFRQRCAGGLWKMDGDDLESQ